MKSRWMIKLCLWGMIGIILSMGLYGCQIGGPTPMPTDEVVEEAYAGKKVLWVDSYHAGYEWSDGIGEGIESVFEGTGVEFKTLHMDTKRNPDENFCYAIAETLSAEIEAFDPDVVITSDDNAQRCLAVPHLTGTGRPVVFCGLNWDASIYDLPNAYSTGMVEVELPQQLVHHLRSYARGDRLVYLTVDSETERKVVGIYNQRFFDGQMVVYTVRTLDEFKAKFIELQDEADMLFVGTNAGIDRWDQAEMEQFFQQHTQVPTGSCYDFMAPYVLVTLAKEAQEQGAWAAQTALQILDGVPPLDIPVAQNEKGVLMLNLDIAERLDVLFAPSMLRHAMVLGMEEETVEKSD